MQVWVIEESTATAFERAVNRAMRLIEERNGIVYDVHITTPTYGVDERRYAFIAVIEYAEEQEDAS